MCKQRLKKYIQKENCITETKLLTKNMKKGRQFCRSFFRLSK